LVATIGGTDFVSSTWDGATFANAWLGMALD